MNKRSPYQYLFRNSWMIAILTLALTTVVSGILIALPHPRVVRAASAMIKINPTSQMYFSRSKINVQGSSFASGETVKVYWDYKGPGTGTLEYSINADTTGSFNQGFILPLGPAGPHTIAAVGKSSGSVATAVFTMLPNLIASPRATGVGSPFSITGQAYGANEAVKVYWNYTGPGTGNLLATVNGDNTGSFQFTATVPSDGSYGRVPIVGIGQSSGASALAKIIVYRLTLALAPLSGPVGTPLTISSYGFQSHEYVNVYWNNGSTPIINDQKTNDNGYLAPTVFTVPSGTLPGSYSVEIVGSTSHLTKTNTFTVTALNSSRAATGLTAKPASSNANTGWPDFGFGPDHLRDNPFENTVNPGNVGKLTMKWSAGIGKAKPVGAPAGAPSPVYYNGIVYIATFDGILKAFDATSGNVKWKFDTQTTFANLSSPVVDPANNMVFFGTLGFLENQDHGVPSPFYAVDAQTGQLIWSIILSSDDYGFPTLSKNTLYIGLAGEGNGSLVALDETLGKIIWHYQPSPNSGMWGAVGIDVKNHAIFSGVGNPGDQVVSLDSQTGKVYWVHTIQSQPGNDDDMGSGIAIYDGNAYATSKNGNMYAIGEHSSTATWITQIGASSIGNVSSPAIDATNDATNGVMYVGSLNGYLYALRAKDGSLVWKTHTGGQIYSSPALANGVVYVASNDNKIYAFDANSGAKLWSFATSGPTFSSPIMVNGMLYCASTDGNLYAFSLA